MKKDVVLGGGTGLSVLLSGLKLFPIDITAVVSVADDGSSTGRLREEFNIPAVGDLRKVLVSLSEVEPLVEQLLEYRFNTVSDLNGHAMGNLMLAALFNITGNLTESLTSLSKILNIKGRVLPFTEDNAVLVAHTKEGEVIEGESKITKAFKHIDYVEYKKPVKATKNVLEALKKADLIIIGIGSLYTSVIPNLLDSNVVKEIKNSKAKKMYVSNIMTEHGETDGFNVSDCIKQINKYAGENIIDVVVANNGSIPKKIQKLYDVEKAEPIKLDYDELKNMGIKVIENDFVKLTKMFQEDGGMRFKSNRSENNQEEPNLNSGKTEIARKINLMETVSPKRFLSILQNGTKPAISDLRLVDDISKNFNLPNCVINALIDYTLSMNDNVLSRPYCEKVAASLAREGVKTTIDAMNFLRKSGRKSTKGSGKKNIYEKGMEEVEEKKPLETKEENISWDELLDDPDDGDPNGKA